MAARGGAGGSGVAGGAGHGGDTPSTMPAGSGAAEKTYAVDGPVYVVKIPGNTGKICSAPRAAMRELVAYHIADMLGVNQPRYYMVASGGGGSFSIATACLPTLQDKGERLGIVETGGAKNKSPSREERGADGVLTTLVAGALLGDPDVVGMADGGKPYNNVSFQKDGRQKTMVKFDWGQAFGQEANRGSSRSRVERTDFMIRFNGEEMQSQAIEYWTRDLESAAFNAEATRQEGVLRAACGVDEGENSINHFMSALVHSMLAQSGFLEGSEQYFTLKVALNDERQAMLGYLQGSVGIEPCTMSRAEITKPNETAMAAVGQLVQPAAHFSCNTLQLGKRACDAGDRNPAVSGSFHALRMGVHHTGCTAAEVAAMNAEPDGAKPEAVLPAAKLLEPTVRAHIPRKGDDVSAAVAASSVLERTPSTTVITHVELLDAAAGASAPMGGAGGDVDGLDALLELHTALAAATHALAGSKTNGAVIPDAYFTHTRTIMMMPVLSMLSELKKLDDSHQIAPDDRKNVAILARNFLIHQLEAVGAHTGGKVSKEYENVLAKINILLEGDLLADLKAQQATAGSTSGVRPTTPAIMVIRRSEAAAVDLSAASKMKAGRTKLPGGTGRDGRNAYMQNVTGKLDNQFVVEVAGMKWKKRRGLTEDGATAVRTMAGINFDNKLTVTPAATTATTPEAGGAGRK